MPWRLAIGALLLLGQIAAGPAVGQPPAVVIEPSPGEAFYGLTPQFALSPDGRQIVYVAGPSMTPASLWVRSLPDGSPRRLAGTEQASYPFWSADSQSIGFFASGKLMKVGAAGGTPAVVCDAPTGRGGTWNADGVIVFTSGITDPLRKVAAAGGPSEVLTRIDTTREGSHRWPVFLPDGKHILFWAGAGRAPAELKIASLDSSEVVSVTPADTNAAYAAGQLYFGRGGALMAQPFDIATLKATSEAVPIVRPLSGDAGSSVASLSASANGTVAYTEGEPRGFRLTVLRRDGHVLFAGTPGEYINVALRPESTARVTCVALSQTAGTPPNRDIWLRPVGMGGFGPAGVSEPCPATRLTTAAGVDASPIWTPDGHVLVFSAQRGGPYQIYRVPADGHEPDQLLFTSEVPAIATDVSRDGRYVAYTRGTAATGLDVWAAPLAGGDSFPLVEGGGADDSGMFSPDGRWLAYQSNGAGRTEIYVRPFAPAGGPRGSASEVIQISTSGGTQPLWRGDGREIFFQAPDGTVMASAITAEAARLTAAPPERLFPAPVSLVIRRAYDVSADGQRFLLPILDDQARQTITVVPAPRP